jgi:hypothetical protein
MINVGSGLTTTAICADVPHVPAAGVKVYKVRPGFVVLTEEGLQVPLIPSFDVGGSADAVAFWQYESGIVVKVGEMLLAMVTSKEAGVAQWPADDGVNM